MSLKTKIEGGIKQAMLARDQDRLRTLRAIKSLILLAETEKGAKEEISEDTEMKLLQKAAKQRKDSLDIYVQQNREDLAAVERVELVIIEEFLPKQMSEAEVEAAVKTVIGEVGAAGPQDIGKVMGAATKKLAGQADGKMISMLAKKLLG
jgi:uncharacterized protein YqeY